MTAIACLEYSLSVVLYIVNPYLSTAHVHAVYQLSPHPLDPPSLISAVAGNNEVSIWDMETATRRQMLWASPAPPFGEMTDKARHTHKGENSTR